MVIINQAGRRTWFKHTHFDEEEKQNWKSKPHPFLSTQIIKCKWISPGSWASSPPSLLSRKGNAFHSICSPRAEGLTLTERLRCLASANLHNNMWWEHSLKYHLGLFLFLLSSVVIKFLVSPVSQPRQLCTAWGQKGGYYTVRTQKSKKLSYLVFIFFNKYLVHILKCTVSSGCRDSSVIKSWSLPHGAYILLG